jgi:SAM-dependent methyltransferase
MKSVARLCAPGRLLDVGCGFGEFAAFAQEQGWQAYGTELAPTRIEAARQLLGKERVFDTDNVFAHRQAGKAGNLFRRSAGRTAGLKAGRLAGLSAEKTIKDLPACRPMGKNTVDGIPDSAGPFEVITAFHVLEHVRNPLAFLKRLRDLLTPAGWLVVEVPNLGALRVRLRKKPLANQLHITHFEPPTLRAALEKSGLRVAAITGAENKGDPPSPLKRALRRARLGIEEGIWKAFGVHLGTNLRATAQK